MEIIDYIVDKAQINKVDFLVIGGHAVNFYGHGRQTGDLDLLVKQSDREIWKKIFLGFKYKVFNEQSAFMQFNPPEIGYWPIDLMIVDESTFAKMEKDSVSAKLGLVKEIKIPSVSHLIALKLHAIKQEDRLDKIKDLQDIIVLIKNHDIAVDTAEFKELCHKYANQAVYEEILRLLNWKTE